MVAAIILIYVTFYFLTLAASSVSAAALYGQNLYNYYSGFDY